MITIEQIKEYIKCPQFGDSEYGKWGALSLEQRKAFKNLITRIEEQDNHIIHQIVEKNNLMIENTNLVKTLEEIEKYIRTYDTNTLDTKTLCILNDILLIKNGVIKSE